MAIKIYIDQGHNPTGYHNTGASWYGQNEQDVTYAVGQELAALLQQDSRFAVRLSRPEENTVLGTSNATSLRRRVEDANDWGADYFLSIHTNASTNVEANGTEMYVYRLESRADALAQQLLRSIVDTVGTRNGGVRARTDLYVLRRTQMPAVLLELGYLSNPSDSEKLRQDRPLFAQAIYQGLLRYFAL